MAHRHPALRVGDLPTRTIPTVPEHLTMGAARKIAALERAALLFVERDGRLVGVVDERAVAEARDGADVAAVMTPIGPCLHPAMSISRARHLFNRSAVSVLPVIVGAFQAGAVARVDVERAFTRARAAARRRGPRVRAAA